MGGCLSQTGQRSRGDTLNQSQRVKSKAAGGDTQLRRDLPKWSSETAITRGALVSKRDEFWETAPMFEGRKEIWDALKNAVEAIEESDFSLAQSIIEAAAIKVPNGTLSETYDELGTKYQVPIYCLAPPENLIKEDDSSSKSSFSHKHGNKVTVRIRISDHNEKTCDLVVNEEELISSAKARAAEKFGIVGSQRWFCKGRIISDSMTVKRCKIPEGFVIQVIVSPPVSHETKEL